MAQIDSPEARYRPPTASSNTSGRAGSTRVGRVHPRALAGAAQRSRSPSKVAVPRPPAASGLSRAVASRSGSVVSATATWVLAVGRRAVGAPGALSRSVRRRRTGPARLFGSRLWRSPQGSPPRTAAMTRRIVILSASAGRPADRLAEEPGKRENEGPAAGSLARTARRSRDDPRPPGGGSSVCCLVGPPPTGRRSTPGGEAPGRAAAGGVVAAGAAGAAAGATQRWSPAAAARGQAAARPGSARTRSHAWPAPCRLATTAGSPQMLGPSLRGHRPLNVEPVSGSRLSSVASWAAASPAARSCCAWARALLAAAAPRARRRE